MNFFKSRLQVIFLCISYMYSVGLGSWRLHFIAYMEITLYWILQNVGNIYQGPTLYKTFQSLTFSYFLIVCLFIFNVLYSEIINCGIVYSLCDFFILHDVIMFNCTAGCIFICYLTITYEGTSLRYSWVIELPSF